MNRHEKPTVVCQSACITHCLDVSQKQISAAIFCHLHTAIFSATSIRCTWCLPDTEQNSPSSLKQERGDGGTQWDVGSSLQSENLWHLPMPVHSVLTRKQKVTKNLPKPQLYCSELNAWIHKYITWLFLPPDTEISLLDMGCCHGKGLVPIVVICVEEPWL